MDAMKLLCICMHALRDVPASEINHCSIMMVERGEVVRCLVVVEGPRFDAQSVASTRTHTATIGFVVSII